MSTDRTPSPEDFSTARDRNKKPQSQWQSKDTCSIFLCQLALFLAAPLFAITTFHDKFTPSLYLGLGIPVVTAQVIILTIAIFSGMRPVMALLSMPKPTKVAALVFLVTVSFVSFLTASYPAIAQLYLLVTLVHLAFALSLSDRLCSEWRGHGERLLVAAGWGAAFYCVLTYLLLFSVRDVTEFDWVHPGVGVSHVRQFGFFGLTSAAVGAGLIATRRPSATGSRTSGGFILLAVGSGMCFWSGGRVNAGALILAVLFSIAMAGRNYRLKVAMTALLALLAGVAVSLIWSPDPFYGLFRILDSLQATGRDLNAYSSNRLQMWQDALELFTQRPLLGYGMGQFKFLVPSSQVTYLHPHNAIIQLLFQWGIVGVAALVVMVSPTWTTARRELCGQRNGTAVLAVTLLAAHLAMSMLEGNLFHVYPVSVVILALVVLRHSAGGDGGAVNRKPSA